MSETVRVGSTSDSILEGAPTGLEGTLTWRLLDADDVVVVAEATAGIEESDEVPGTYRREVTWPETAGVYTAVWRNGSVQVTETFTVAFGLLSGDYDLTSLDAVRSHLQKRADDTDQDEVIEQLIRSASWTIVQRYGQFRPTETATAKTFVWDGGHRLSLFPYYLRAITSVGLDTDTSSTTTLETTDYGLRPMSPFDGVYRWLRLPNHQVEVGLERQVTITGDWGYPDGEIPPDIEQACIITVVEWMRRGVQAFGTGFATEEDAGLAPAGLPMAAKRLLMPYDRHGQG